MFEAIIIVSLYMLLQLVKKIMKNNYKIMNPASLMIYVWILNIGVHALYFPKDDYTLITYFFIFLGLIMFVFGFLLFQKRNLIGRSEQTREYNPNKIGKLLIIFTIIEIVRIIYIVLVVYKIAGSIDTFINNSTWVRIQYLERSMNLIQTLFEFFTNANALIAYVLVGIYFGKKFKKHKVFLVLWTVFELLYAIVSMSKMCLILYLIVVGVTYLNNIGIMRIQKKVFIKYIPFIAIGVFAFLIVIANQRNYSTDGGSMIESVIRKAIFYFSSGIEGIAKYMDIYGSNFEMGSNTFNIFARVLSRIGLLNDASVLSHAEYIDTIYETTNVYTWFRPFYLDYSYLGFIIMPFIFGIISGLFYNPQKHNLFLDVCSSWISALVAISFYNFLWGQTIYVFVLIYSYVLHHKLGNKIYLKRI